MLLTPTTSLGLFSSALASASTAEDNLADWHPDRYVWTCAPSATLSAWNRLVRGYMVQKLRGAKRKWKRCFDDTMDAFYKVGLILCHSRYVWWFLRVYGENFEGHEALVRRCVFVPDADGVVSA